MVSEEGVVWEDDCLIVIYGEQRGSVCVCARVGGINDINREHKCVKGRRDETVGKKTRD